MRLFNDKGDFHNKAWPEVLFDLATSVELWTASEVCPQHEHYKVASLLRELGALLRGAREEGSAQLDKVRSRYEEALQDATTFHARQLEEAQRQARADKLRLQRQLRKAEQALLAAKTSHDNVVLLNERLQRDLHMLRQAKGVSP